MLKVALPVRRIVDNDYYPLHKKDGRVQTVPGLTQIDGEISNSSLSMAGLESPRDVAIVPHTASFIFLRRQHAMTTRVALSEYLVNLPPLPCDLVTVASEIY